MRQGYSMLLALVASMLLPSDTWSSPRPACQPPCAHVGPAPAGGRLARTAMLRLRGGSFFSAFDQQLQDEILNDIKRHDKGKLPLFIERLGEEEQTGAFKYGVGVEAAMPPVLGDAPDAAMEDEGGGGAATAGSAPTAPAAAQTREQREAEEQRAAQAWFAEQDKKYFHWSEFADDDPIIGHTGIPQRRELELGEPLESYLELRKDCAELSRFMRTLPRNRTQIAQVLEDTGWHEGILRNGTRIKWEPGLRVIDMSSLSEEEEDDDDVDFETHDGAWFRETIHALAKEAWQVESPADTDFGEFFKQRNSTFNQLASMNAFLNDSFILSCDDWIKAAAGDDPHRLRAREHLWKHYDVKWQEFVEDERCVPCSLASRRPTRLCTPPACAPAIPLSPGRVHLCVLATPGSESAQASTHVRMHELSGRVAADTPTSWRQCTMRWRRR
jgi:hypothetical protein